MPTGGGGPGRQTLGEILDWHRGIVEALVAQRGAVLRAARDDWAVPPRFVGMTGQDLDAYYDSQRRELDWLTILNLVASVEATIRVDYFRRVEGKLKDPLAKAYRRWHKTLSHRKRRRPDFDEGGILDEVRGTQLVANPLIGRYRECLRTRHWVGHGRYWPRPVGVNSLDPVRVYDRCRALLEAWPP